MSGEEPRRAGYLDGLYAAREAIEEEAFTQGGAIAQIDELIDGAGGAGPSTPEPGGRRFPIQTADSIPWGVAQRAYEAYATRFGKSQSLERLAERGGFAVSEMDAFLPGWRDLAYPVVAPSTEPALDVERRIRQAFMNVEMLDEVRGVVGHGSFVDRFVAEYARLAESQP